MARVTVMTFVLVSGNQSSESESIHILVSQKQNRSKIGSEKVPNSYFEKAREY